MTHRLRAALGAAALIAAALTLSACSAPASVVGTWGDTGAKDKPSLVFEENGEFHGTDGCNQVGGSWKADGSKIDLGAMRTTLMFCDGVDTWLAGAATATLKGDTLTVNDQGGAEIGTLNRAK